jgi:adenine deaminase
MHIESGMLTPGRVRAAVIPHGTTTMFTDPHEIANVLGLRGVRMMHDEAALQPVSIFTQMPSCAPSAPGLETTGFEITEADVEEAMAWPGIVGLGEMMNYPGVVNGDPQMLAEMAATMRAGKTWAATTRAPTAASPSTPTWRRPRRRPRGHAGIRRRRPRPPGDALDAAAGERLVRRGKPDHRDHREGPRPAELHPVHRRLPLGTLVNDGHMDRVVRHAIACGADPLVALQMATVNTATHFGLERELGLIARPPRRPDPDLLADRPPHRGRSTRGA